MSAPVTSESWTANGQASDAEHYRRLLDRLFSMLSHDLRTPLSAISGWLFLLDSDRLDAAGRKRALDKIRNNLEEQVRLIDDTLALARANAGTLKLDRSRVDIGALVGQVAERMQLQAAAKSATIVHATDAPSPLMVDADEPRLRRALELIVERAIRDVDTAKGRDARVAIHASAQGATISVVVDDNGRGIAPEALPWVIDPFGSPVDPQSGSRHGPDRCLLIAAALVEAAGGRLAVTSQGSTDGVCVTLTFPSIAAAAPGG